MRGTIQLTTPESTEVHIDLSMTLGELRALQEALAEVRQWPVVTFTSELALVLHEVDGRKRLELSDKGS